MALQVEEFIKAVVAYGLKPYDLLPLTRIVGGKETVSIQRNGIARTYDGSTEWARQAISDLHAGVWGPRP